MERGQEPSETKWLALRPRAGPGTCWVESLEPSDWMWHGPPLLVAKGYPWNCPVLQTQGGGGC